MPRPRPPGCSTLPPARCMTGSRARPTEPGFYFDADVLGLAHVVASLRSDATYPGDPGAVIKRRERLACPMADSATKHDVWIPHVASLGWLMIIRDSRIQQHRAEIAAVKGQQRAHGRTRRRRGARNVATAGDRNEAVACHRGSRSAAGPVLLHRHTLVLRSHRPGLTDENGSLLCQEALLTRVLGGVVSASAGRVSELSERAIRMTPVRDFLAHDLVVTLAGGHQIWPA